MPAKQPRSGAAGAVGGVLQHRERFVRRELAAAQRDHADAGRDVVIEHHDRVFIKASDDPVPHRAYPAHTVGNCDLLRQRDIRVSLSLAFGYDERRCWKQPVARDRM